MTEADLIPPADKGAHFIAGALIFAVAMCLTHRPVTALLIAASFAAGKELADLLRNRMEIAAGQAATHDPSWLDFAWTCLGGIVPFVAVCAR